MKKFYEHKETSLSRPRQHNLFDDGFRAFHLYSHPVPPEQLTFEQKNLYMDGWDEALRRAESKK